MYFYDSSYHDHKQIFEEIFCFYKQVCFSYSGSDVLGGFLVTGQKYAYNIQVNLKLKVYYLQYMSLKHRLTIGVLCP